LKSWQKYAAEVLGTFILVFIGSLAIISSGGGADPGGRIMIAFGFGIALLAGLYAFGEVSGGHFNPIVSLAMFLDRRLSALETIWYWIAQFVGAIVASLLILVTFADRDAVKATATRSSSDARGFFLELICSAIFVAVILQVTRSNRYGSSALIAIPLTLFAIHIALVPLTGSSVNPARSFAPTLVGATAWSDIWIYILAPPAGAIIGWAAHMVTVRGDTSLRDDLERAAGDMRGVQMDDIRQGPGQVPPPPSPSEPDNPSGPGQV
jgi:aquaporin Z